MAETHLGVGSCRCWMAETHLGGGFLPLWDGRDPPLGRCLPFWDGRDPPSDQLPSPASPPQLPSPKATRGQPATRASERPRGPTLSSDQLTPWGLGRRFFLGHGSDEARQALTVALCGRARDWVESGYARPLLAEDGGLRRGKV